jgi:hypothetical protein
MIRINPGIKVKLSGKSLFAGMTRTTCLLLAIMALRLAGIAQNPFVTNIYTADPSAHVWADGRLYIYPSHDVQELLSGKW